MQSIDPGKNFQTWRQAAKKLITAAAAPEEIIWEKPDPQNLFHTSTLRSDTAEYSTFSVPKEFPQLAKSVACHQSEQRWALLYRILWRIVIGRERHLCSISSDPDIAKAHLLAKSVRREIHKMHAFVRFKLVDTDPETSRERYAAWFEPDHHIVEAATPFFRKRFANMDWSIFTPKGCAHWDGKTLRFSEGIPENPVEDPDALEAIWRTYYRSIFNPARLKVKAMTTEMPKRYWKNLPEADLIQELISESTTRVTHMMQEPLRPAKPAPKNKYLESLRQMSEAPPPEEPPSI
ncbi:MAG: TIGR03915 family putative DNA repair protein [Akkermansiaceae bacterium]|nr:TIGR03915 family putative DNA repair protein [Akkermansiaceae bacterium]